LEKAGHALKNEGLVEKGQAKREAAGSGGNYGSSGQGDSYGSNDNSNNNY
jgi:hypothetical protein